MKSKAFLTGVVAILLSLVTVTAPAAAQGIPSGWYQKDYAPTRTFIHYWNGTFLGTENGLQEWELYSELMMMMPGGMMMGGGAEWVKMTIAWDALKLSGQVVKFDHHGENLTYSGWEGPIWFNPVYHFNVSGVGSGTYRVNGTLYNLIIYGWFAGDYHADNETNPFVSGNSSATERATLYYGILPPVGGYDVAPNYLAILFGFAGPWIVAVAVSSVTLTVLVKKTRRRCIDKPA